MNSFLKQYANKLSIDVELFSLKYVLEKIINYLQNNQKNYWTLLFLLWWKYTAYTKNVFFTHKYLRKLSHLTSQAESTS